ncbi:MAG: hypothetical protein Q9186_002439 [Xanthomendoza sp. 1 TL-2023]
MTHYRQDFVDRYPPEQREEKEYHRARRELYPGVGGGYPGPQYFEDGYDAPAAHAEIDKLKEPGRLIRRSYDDKLRSSRGYVDHLGAEQTAYYRTATRGITPKDHADLKPLARGYAESEYTHANAREQIYGRSPMMYGSAKLQREHYDHVGDHYDHADYAEMQYAEHSRYAMDPSSSAMDLYNRPVPAGFEPYNDGYPGSNPPEGYYSTKHGNAAPALVGEPSARMSQKERKRNRRGF